MQAAVMVGEEHYPHLPHSQHKRSPDRGESFGKEREGKQRRKSNMVCSRVSTAVIAVVVMIGIATSLVEGQSNPPSCASKLVGCASFFNSTNPPSSCCDPLKEAIDKELDCLCNLYANPTLLRQFGVDINQALSLPQRCGISGDISACKALAPGSSATPPPPATPGSGVGKIAWSGLTSMVLLWVSMMFC